MPNVTALGQVGPATAADGSQLPARQGRSGELVVSELNGRYYEQAVRGNLYMAHAIVTAPVVYSATAGMGGPLLWNGSANINAALIAVGFGTTVVTTVAAGLGITGNISQPSAPTTTTAIDSRTNLRLGGAASACTPYRVGTVANAGAFFLPFSELHTGALTVSSTGVQWTDFGGMVVVPPQSWISVAASATTTTTVAQISMIWAELPV